jgi:hypothetical protein
MTSKDGYSPLEQSLPEAFWDKRKPSAPLGFGGFSTEYIFHIFDEPLDTQGADFLIPFLL